MGRPRKNPPKEPPPSGPASTGTYPDLTPVLQALWSKMGGASADERPILEKWSESLRKINAEMRRLEKLEQFTRAIKKQ